jgi:hypothetical protein
LKHRRDEKKKVISPFLTMHLKKKVKQSADEGHMGGNVATLKDMLTEMNTHARPGTMGGDVEYGDFLKLLGTDKERGIRRKSVLFSTPISAFVDQSNRLSVYCSGSGSIPQAPLTRTPNRIHPQIQIPERKNLLSAMLKSTREEPESDRKPGVGVPEGVKAVVLSRW